MDTYILQLPVAVLAKMILENNYTKATFVRAIALGGPPKVDVRRRGEGGRAKRAICGQGGGSKNSNFVRTAFMESPLKRFTDEVTPKVNVLHLLRYFSQA